MENFEEHLMEKYPNLFPKDKDGKTTYSDCGVSCPVGWEDLVNNLCGSIDFYVKNNHKIKQTNKIRYYLWKFFWNNLKISKLFNFAEKRIDPVDWSNNKCILSSKAENIRSDFPKRNKARKLLLEIRSKIYPRHKYKFSPIPKVTINQIKQKTDLRFYYDGGDETVRGMAAFAEKMSRSICEETGLRGFPCINRGWIRTLSEEKMNEFGYSRTK